MNAPSACPRLMRQLCDLAEAFGCSDLHLQQNAPPFYRHAGQLIPLSQLPLEHLPYQLPDELADDSQLISAETVATLAGWLIGENGLQQLTTRGSVDGATVIDGLQHSLRIRYNVFRCHGHTAIAIRRLEDHFRTLPELGLSPDLYSLCDLKDGLVLVAGPTGSGKSTTLASLIDRINQRRAAHIVTIEDPIEFVHRNAQALISQRQVALDTTDFAQALVDALRQDPDVILVGEMRDLQTIRTAIEAAETGHLVLASVHAGDAIAAIERMVGVFPGDERPLINQMLSSSLRAVIVQHLLPRYFPTAAQASTADENGSGRRVLASEVLRVNTAVSNLIGNSQLPQIRSVMETSHAAGMYTLDAHLAKLLRQRKIESKLASSLARNPKMMLQLARTQ